ncbi:HNH endonuclease [Niastella sp. OAS944]|uniref:HNH endonuclease n=1 Tax=Niastella sp. OAS944 TaxID=2664089 RepID=UPI00349756B3|nr:5-methylcytosine-specific restriction endonuclease McrA [Chitinophagaceae bacterium OAS944]
MTETDFLKRFASYIQLSRKEDLAKQYTANIEPFLRDVADELSVKYATEKLYPHISNFRTHVTFRLGPDKKMTHRASVGVSFGNDYVTQGFHLTHALSDAHLLRSVFRKKTDEIATGILKFQDYTLWLPNAGITESTPIYSFTLPKLKRVLLKYDPIVMRDCYFHISTDYASSTMSKKQLIDVFELEHKNFAFLLNIILHQNKPGSGGAEADENKLQQRTREIRRTINLTEKPTGEQKPRKTETTTTIYFRDPAVRAWVLENAKGKCEACGSNAPFILADGYPFLEVHHMIPLALGGPDIIENTIALCPNCHRKCHLSNEKDSFNNEIYKKVLRLEK